MTGSESAEQFDYLIQAQVHQSDFVECKKMQDLLNQAALQANGFIDQQASYRTLDNGLLECNVRLRFSDIQSCLAWIDSPIRRRLLNEAETNFVHQFQSGVHKPSFDLWLMSQLPGPPPIWKMNLLVWLALYPAVMSLSLISVDTLGQLPLALNMLISTAIAVAITGWLLVPLLAKAYKRWLQTQSYRFNMAGGGSILGMLLVFYALFSSPNLLNWLSHSSR